MTFIVYFINVQDSRVTLMESLETEHEAYQCLGKHLFVNQEKIQYIKYHLDSNEQVYTNICKKDILNFDEKFRVDMGIDEFTKVFSPFFINSKSIIDKLIDDNNEDCNNYDIFGIKKG